MKTEASPRAEPAPGVRTRCALRIAVVLAVLALLIGCGGPQEPKHPTEEPLFRTAIVTTQMVERGLAIEAGLERTYHAKAPKGRPWFRVLRGSSPVVVVAGHATAHRREDRFKTPDKGTGSLAVMLNEIAQAHVIYTTYRSPSDPNYADDNAFREAVLELVRKVRPVVVIDIHASNGARPFDIDFGTLGGASLKERVDLLELLGETMRREGIRNFSQDYFAAAKQQTVTRLLMENTSTPSFQMEINANYLLTSRSDEMEQHRFAQLLQGLVRYIRKLQKPEFYAED